MIMYAFSDGVVEMEAPAKLNLYLHVIGRREDGYHELDSLVAFASVGDQLRVERAPELSLEIDGLFSSELDTEDGNIVWRAAEAVRASAEISDGARITLTKSLPVASGIGGGSADAAAAVEEAAVSALVRLWGLRSGSNDLSRLAFSLGSDVPVCLFGRCAYMRGIGQRITPGPALPSIYLVLVNPGIAVSTPDVFAACEEPYSKISPELDETDDVGDFVDQLARRGNDLWMPAINTAPIISNVIDVLEAAEDCLLARMSGSGPTCYGLFETRDQANRAAEDITENFPTWWVKSANLIG